MTMNGINIRWIDAACYEIVLPNKKVIILDPYKNPLKSFCFKVDDITGADYILCTHTHYDHTMNIGELSQKFKSKILIESMAALPLAEYFDIPCGQIYSLTPNDHYEFEDFKLDVYRSKHVRYDTPDDERPSNVQNMGKKMHGLHGYEMLDKIGSIASLDFLITTNNNIRILISSGANEYNNIFYTAKDKCPNILIRQASRQGTPEEFARLLSRFGAQIIFPHHQENIPRSSQMTAEEYLESANSMLNKIFPYCQLINPMQFQWYSIGMSVQAELRLL